MEILTKIEKYRVFIRIYKNKTFEFVRFNSKTFSFCLFIFYSIQYIITRLFLGEFKAMILAGKMFRRTRFAFSRHIATNILKKSIEKHGAEKVGQELLNIIKQNIDPEILSRLVKSIKNVGTRPFDRRLLILSHPINDQKGVIIIKFTEHFKYAFQIFNMQKLKNDYVLVLEPSASGYFDEEILCLMSVDIPIIIQSPEPVDLQFVKSLNANYYPIEIAANCWVDSKIFFPIENIEKKYDVIMVAIWADVKRHYHLFEELSKCKYKHNVALIGKPWPKTVEDIKDEARYYNVLDQIEFFEDLSQKQVNVLLNKAKCFLLLSKKEGCCKAIIESMYANTPGFFIEGFNYGYKYPFINAKTGGFVPPNKLTQFLDNINEIIDINRQETSRTIKSHMSPALSTGRIINMLNQIENERDVKINKNITIKVNNPEMDYLDPAEWDNMKPYYKGLKSYLNKNI